MNIEGSVAVVTGGASGLGKATVENLIDNGAAAVIIADLPGSDGKSVAEALGEAAHFVAADVTSTEQMKAVFDYALGIGSLRVVVHCAGRGGPVRLIEKNGEPGSLETYTAVINVNLVGSFNVLRLAAVAMMKGDLVGEERGVVVMTSSIAAWEGQIGQIPYASSKAGVVGMTLVAARDLASKRIRVCTIAPGLFDTPILQGVQQKVRDSLAANIPNPSRMGQPPEFAMMVNQIIRNPMVNGETIRLDGALRMAPR